VSKARDVPRFVVITPCRDEEDHLEALLHTVVEQTFRPTVWVIVDDGSTDRTPEILRAASRRHPFIRVHRRVDRGCRKVGPGVVKAFYAGLGIVDELQSFDYLCKLDADLELPPRYFELLCETMASEPRLGNLSGKVAIRQEDGTLITERMGDENAIGAAKFYRTACFRDIGGFVHQVSWDGIDGHLCRLRGWIARSEDREGLRIVHRRRMGSSEVDVWTGRKRGGYGKYYMGSAPYYMLAVAAYRIFERPFVLGGIGILAGYFQAWLWRKARFKCREFRKHLRRYELMSLLRGKRATAARYHSKIKDQEGRE